MTINDVTTSDRIDTSEWKSTFYHDNCQDFIFAVFRDWLFWKLNSNNNKNDSDVFSIVVRDSAPSNTTVTSQYGNVFTHWTFNFTECEPINRYLNVIHKSIVQYGDTDYNMKDVSSTQWTSDSSTADTSHNSSSLHSAVTLASDVTNDTNLTTSTLTATPPYDSHGAMLFIVATILIYALSIMTMIASTLGRSLQDDEVKSFLKGYAALDIRKCEKRKVKDVLQKKNIQVSNSSASSPDTASGGSVVKEARCFFFTRQESFVSNDWSIENEATTTSQRWQPPGGTIDVV